MKEDQNPSLDNLISHLEEMELTTVHGPHHGSCGNVDPRSDSPGQNGRALLNQTPGSPLAAEVVGFTKMKSSYRRLAK